MRARILPVLLLCAASAQAGSLHTTSGIVDGPGVRFLLAAPAGWVLDNDSGQPDGIPAVLYPTGRTWENSEVVMYAVGIAKDAETKNAADVIDSDTKRFTRIDPALSVKKGARLATADAKRVEVREYEPSRAGHRQAVAYIEEPGGIVTLVLSSRTEPGFNRARSAFADLVKSYRSLDLEKQDTVADIKPPPETDSATTTPPK